MWPLFNNVWHANAIRVVVIRLYCSIVFNLVSDSFVHVLTLFALPGVPRLIPERRKRLLAWLPEILGWPDYTEPLQGVA